VAVPIKIISYVNLFFITDVIRLITVLFYYADAATTKRGPPTRNLNKLILSVNAAGVNERS